MHIDLIIEGLARESGRLMIACDTQKQWLVGIEFGREDEDSDMYAAAAYGVGATAQEAITKALAETGWR
ncbi:MAG: hypothetical protein ACT4NY_09185 [Pseudonocardiales bacterium]